MRRFVHVLLIALLLLRGGMDVAMATTMAGSIPVTPHHAMMMAEGATPDAEPAATASQHDTMGDCAGHAVAMQDQGADTPTSDASHADCDSCSVCQACHSVALSSSTATPTDAQTVRVVPMGAHSQFASADTAQGQKPPIS